MNQERYKRGRGRGGEGGWRGTVARGANHARGRRHFNADNLDNWRRAFWAWIDGGMIGPRPRVRQILQRAA